MEQQILNSYTDIFQSYSEMRGGFLETHVAKLRELDQFIPHSSTFFCVTNTTNRSFEFVSKNFTACTGLDIHAMCNEGMTFWWSRMHPEEMNLWIQSLTDLMEFTMAKVPTEDRKKVSYSWNYQIKIADGCFRPLLQHTTPMYFDDEGKPVIGLAHYSILPKTFEDLPIQATAKILNDKQEYETIYWKAYGKQKLLSEDISNRERDILRLVSYGYNSEEIGDKLFISKHTVNVHRRNILGKSNCRNTTELVSRCIREGWL